MTAMLITWFVIIGTINGVPNDPNPSSIHIEIPVVTTNSIRTENPQNEVFYKSDHQFGIMNQKPMNADAS